ncbi:MAG: hypothetical protein LBL73_09725 [Synergistaceae bacterium]|nr:hypothetical protein [Synergistaceae bacterium]
MAKNKAGGDAGYVEIRNLKDGPRSYPLADGTSLLLPGRHRGAAWPAIPAEKVNDILRKAERRGLIEIAGKKGGGAVGAGNAESDMD